jgi:glycosyltransferase involved in cell wall biosynthesis
VTLLSRPLIKGFWSSWVTKATVKQVAIVGTVGLPARYGGFETLAEYLADHLAHTYQITVYCSSKSYEERPSRYKGVSLRYVPLNANGIQSILYDVVALISAVRFADTVLVLGVSGCIILPFLKALTSNRYVVNIDGLEWKRGKWHAFAKWFLRFSEKLAVRYADAVITDNKVIQDYVLEEYSRETTLIAYGGNQAANLDVSEATSVGYPFVLQPYAFSVCRIEPENNLHVILEAAGKSSSLPLVIVGNWEASDYGRKLRAQYSGVPYMYLLDPIYNQNELDQLRSHCCLYLHGHSAGGTNPSLVEAMSLGLPIFAFDVDYNRETTEHAACYFSSAEELTCMLDSLSERELVAAGERMAAIAGRRYRWDIVANQYAALF